MIIKKQPLISCSRIDKGKSNSSQTKHKTYEIETKSKPQRAQGGKGLLSHSISVQSLKNPWFKSYPREEREEEQEGREETHGEERGERLNWRKREERVGERYLSPLTLELKD